MEYILNGTTKRYLGNKHCTFNNFKFKDSDKYQFGCEFEFYINTDLHDYKIVIDDILRDIYELTNVDILVDLISLPIDADKNNCLQIKPDMSLKDNGLEISVPITSKAGITHFIETVCPIINKYGYTNEETGFHIHISTRDSDGSNFNFYKYMLLCHKANLLSSWKERPGYSQNVMDILLKNDKLKTREIKTKKGTVWNLEKIEANHVEIKSIGGDDYHTDIKKITKEFLKYIKCFEETLLNDTDTHKLMYLEHKEHIKNLSSDIQSSFSVALTEAGILE